MTPRTLAHLDLELFEQERKQPPPGKSVLRAALGRIAECETLAGGRATDSIPCIWRARPEVVQRLGLPQQPPPDLVSRKLLVTALSVLNQTVRCNMMLCQTYRAWWMFQLGDYNEHVVTCRVKHMHSPYVWTGRGADDAARTCSCSSCRGGCRRSCIAGAASSPGRGRRAGRAGECSGSPVAAASMQSPRGRKGLLVTSVSYILSTDETVADCRPKEKLQGHVQNGPTPFSRDATWWCQVALPIEPLEVVEARLDPRSIKASIFQVPPGFSLQKQQNFVMSLHRALFHGVEIHM